MAQRFAGFESQMSDFRLEFLDVRLKRGSVNDSSSGFVAAFVGFPGVERLRTLRSITINRHALDAHAPRFDVGVANVGDSALAGHIDGLGNRATDERLRGGHHFQMRQVTDAALALMRFERAIEDQQMVRFQAAANGRTIFPERLQSCRVSRCAR